MPSSRLCRPPAAWLASRAPGKGRRAFSTAFADAGPSVDDHVKRVCQNCASRPEREPDAGQGPPGLDPMTRRSFYQRELPPSLVGFASTQGKARFLEAAASGTAEGYFPLAEQFITQGEPAFCGPSCLAMVLNTLRIDPNTTWKGGWRWFDEHTLASSCCKPLEAIHQEGITLDEFAALGRCHGAAVNVFRPIEGLPPLHVSRPGEAAGSAHTFREAVRSACSDSKPPHLVVSFLRTALSQTGTGHFSPVAAYHAPSDSALVLDIARFKLPPYWVPIRHLYDAMLPHDAATGLPRGYVLLGGAPQLAGAERNMAQLGGGGGRCPVHAIKRQYCPVGLHARTCTDVKACHPRRQASQAGRVIRAAAEAGSAPAIAAAAGECGAPV